MSRDESLRRRAVLFWAYLGPFMVILTLFVASAQVALHHAYLSLTALVGLPLCWRWRAWGLCGALGILGVFLLFGVMELPVSQRFWYMGLGLSVALAFIIVTLASAEAKQRLEDIEGSAEQLEAECRSLLETQRSEGERYLAEIAELEQCCLDLQQDCTGLTRLLKAQEEGLKQAQQDISRSHEEYQRLLEESLVQQQKNTDLAQELEKLQCREVSVSVSEPDPGRRLKEELEGCRQQIENLKAEAAEAKGETSELELRRELARVRGLYQQLRQQFEEKDSVLHQVRKDLFETEGELLGLRRQWEELECQESTEKERELSAALSRAMQESTVNQEEVLVLSELVDSLMSEAASSRE